MMVQGTGRAGVAMQDGTPLEGGGGAEGEATSFHPPLRLGLWTCCIWVVAGVAWAR